MLDLQFLTLSEHEGFKFQKPVQIIRVWIIPQDHISLLKKDRWKGPSPTQTGFWGLSQKPKAAMTGKTESQTSVSPGVMKTFIKAPVEKSNGISAQWQRDSSSKAPQGGFLACVTPGRVSHPPLIIKEAGRPPPIKHHYHLTPPGPSPSVAPSHRSSSPAFLPTSGDRPVAPQRLIIDVCPSAPRGPGLPPQLL